MKALVILAIGFPRWGLVQPGQPAPYDVFPWFSTGIVAAGFIYALILTQRDPNLEERVGSIVADEK